MSKVCRCDRFLNRICAQTINFYNFRRARLRTVNRGNTYVRILRRLEHCEATKFKIVRTANPSTMNLRSAPAKVVRIKLLETIILNNPVGWSSRSPRSMKNT